MIGLSIVVVCVSLFNVYHAITSQRRDLIWRREILAVIQRIDLSLELGTLDQTEIARWRTHLYHLLKLKPFKLYKLVRIFDPQTKRYITERKERNG